MLKIKDCIFEENFSTRDTSFMCFENDGELSWSIDCLFEEGELDDETIMPSICINPIEAEVTSVGELVGTTFSVDLLEDSDEREDSFSIYDAFPMPEYTIEILEITDDKVHVSCKGKLIVDEDEEEDFITEDFEMDSWLPLILSVDDWEKFGL